MEVLRRENNHLYKGGEKEYGCTCKYCGTVFIFQEHEGHIPLTFKNINSKPEECTVNCPNCKQIIRYSECTEFKNQIEKGDFKREKGVIIYERNFR